MNIYTDPDFGFELPVSDVEAVPVGREVNIHLDPATGLLVADVEAVPVDDAD